MSLSRTGLGALTALLLAAATPVQAQAAADASLPSVKAAFVFNFIKLVSWPERRFESDSAPVQVCVLRGDSMEPALRQSLGGKMAGARPVEVSTVGSDDNLSGCHVLYLGSQASVRYTALMTRVAGKGVLLIDEGEQFTWPDGMIRLFLEQSRVRFELNLDSVERAGLKVDPRLIRLARIASR